MGRLSMAAAVGQAALGARRQWRAMPAERRARMQTLLKRSASGPASLSAAERDELRGLVRELKLGEVARTSAARVTRRGFFRRG
jgi:hypothetical protein